MLSLSLQDSPFPSEQPRHLSINRIEVFVIPALAIYSAGYRVCLRISSNLGNGWSEQFVSDTEPSLQFDRWSPILRPFIGYFPLHSLSDSLTELIAQTVNPENRAYRLFASAIEQFQHSNTQRALTAADSVASEESVLQKRAVAYLSVD